MDTSNKEGEIMTNKQYLLTLSDKECAEKIRWLWAHYSLCYTDSLLAVQDWLGEEYIEENND